MTYSLESTEREDKVVFKVILGLVVATFATGALATEKVDVNSLYQAVVDNAQKQQRFQEVKQSDLNQGAGKNANASTASNADMATTLASAEKNAIISAARNGTAKAASYASTAGTATKVATTERNAIIRDARSGMDGISMESVCKGLPSFTTDASSSNYYYSHTWQWSGGKCSMVKVKKTRSCGSGGPCGGDK